MAIDSTCVAKMRSAIQTTCPSKYADQLEQPITSEEILSALRAGAWHKAPGNDGFSLEFYTDSGETIHPDLLELLNQMFLHKKITLQQKHGIIVCLPKSNGDRTPEGYRPISLLSTEYKILAPIMARRLLLVLQEHLHNSQFCGIPGNSFLEAVSPVRDAITYSNRTGTPLCVLSLDFQNAFDRISHQYLFQILQRYGISAWLIERLQTLYEKATASVQINGALAGPISIHSAVRQGCPLGMVLYALCLHPLLRTLEHHLPSFKIGHRTCSFPVVAYADDIKVFITRPEDFTIILQAVRSYEQATGARLSRKKSKALVIGPWTEPATALGIEFHDQATNLGVTFGTTIVKSFKDSLAGVLRTVRAQARKAYARNLCLAQRIQYVHLWLLAKIWYLAQVFPPTTVHVQQLTTVCSWFIWLGATFRVPVSTLQRPKEHGGWALAIIDVKCRTLL
jgi:hypothetical protein